MRNEDQPVIDWYLKLEEAQRQQVDTFLNSDQSRLIAFLCQSGQHLDGFDGQAVLNEPD